MTPEAWLCAFAAACLLVASVPQLKARRRYSLGELGRHRGADEAFADQLREWWQTDEMWREHAP